MTDLPTFSKTIKDLVAEQKSKAYTAHGLVKAIKTHLKGYLTFELREEKHLISCYVPRTMTANPAIADGTQVAVTGHIQLWDKDTRLQFYVTAIAASSEPATVKESSEKLCTAFEKKFKKDTVTLIGTVQNLSKKYTSTFYFDLSFEGYSLNCKVKKSICKFELEDGELVEVTGSISLWKNECRLQLEVQQIEQPHAVPVEFQPMIKILEAKALWPKTRMPIPESVERIGLVTGKDTFAFGDFHNIYQREGGSAEVFHQQARMQGKNAPGDIVRAVNSLSREQKVDVIVITRGGGSEKDLEAFNDIEIAEAICHSRIPVITAIGHHADTSLADVVADFQASSPTDAAYVLAKKSTQEKTAIR